MIQLNTHKIMCLSITFLNQSVFLKESVKNEDSYMFCTGISPFMKELNVWII